LPNFVEELKICYVLAIQTLAARRGLLDGGGARRVVLI
jgi:hypothetical protein